MHWFWWVVIIFVALIIVNKICEDNPGFRHVLCCILSLAYPILAIIHIDDPNNGFVLWAILGPIVVAFYKYVYGLAEMLENDGAGDLIGTFLMHFDDNEVTVMSIVVSVIISVVFAAIPIGLVFLFAQFSKFLACVMLFLPLVYCVICAIRYFREQY